MTRLTKLKLLIVWAALIFVILALSILFTIRGVYIAVTARDPGAYNWIFVSLLFWLLAVLSFQGWKWAARSIEKGIKQ